MWEWHLRLESQDANHRFYFNGVLMLSYIDSVYTTGQPGVADSVFGGPHRQDPLLLRWHPWQRGPILRHAQ